MDKHYFVIKNWGLTTDLLNNVQLLDRKYLEIGTIYNRINVVKALRHYHQLSWPTILKEWAFAYGVLFSRVGTIESLKLPDYLEKEVLMQLSTIFCQSVIDDCTVRLQVVYGGNYIPPHIDITRTASLICPISNHNSAHTVFYQLTRPISKTEQIFKLNSLQEDTRVIINEHPVLFDTKTIHAVMYPSSISKSNPRLSISIKWKSLKIKQIMAGIKTQ